MVQYLKAKDTFTSRKTADGHFEEYPLIVTPTSFVMCDQCMDLVTVPSESILNNFLSQITGSNSTSSISSSYALSASIANIANTSDFAVLAGTAITATSASYALTSSYVYPDGYSGSITIFGKTGITHSLGFVNGRLMTYSAM